MKRFLYVTSLGLIFLLFGCIEDSEFSNEIRNAGKPVLNGGASLVDKTAAYIEVSAEVLKENGAAITERGFCYSTEANPTVENGVKVSDASLGIGSFSKKLEGLAGNTTYYIRSFATNDKGTEYGTPELAVSTNDGLGVVITLEPSDVYAIKANVGGRISQPGEGEIITRGVYFSTDRDFASNNSVISSDNDDTYSCQLIDLTPVTKYYVRAFVTNTYGTFVGSVDSFITRNGLPLLSATVVGNIGFTDVILSSDVSDGDDVTVEILERGFCWSIAPNHPTIEGDTIHCGFGTGVFEATINGLVANEQYYVRSFAKSRFGLAYGEEISFSTKKEVPTVVTHDPKNIQIGTAEVGGAIVDEGSNSVSVAGICWSETNSNPTLSDNVMNLPVYPDSTFLGRLTNLKGSGKYYYRAFATNAQGTSYGTVKDFTAPPVFYIGLAPFPGSVRLPNSAAYFAIGDNFYMLGGDIGSKYTDELWYYSVAEDVWRSRWAFKGGEAKWQFGIRYGSDAFVYGGIDENGNEVPDLYRYESNSNMWSGPFQAPDTLYQTVGYAYSNSLYYIGGKSDTVKNNVWSYHVVLDQWKKETDFPVKQYGGIAVVINNIAYVGMGKDELNICNGKIWYPIYDVDTQELIWYLKTTCPTSMYSGNILAGVACRQRIYVIDSDYYILEYEPVTNVWMKKSQLPAGSRNIHCVYEMGSKIYIGLGSSNSLIIYDPTWDN
ncbi:MAG: hypothetical protein LBT42_07120 [Tannerella sp.]|jgi:hypothetical protein|nr:hypothetical protein [Tannerella sp.]